MNILVCLPMFALLQEAESNSIINLAHPITTKSISFEDLKELNKNMSFTLSTSSCCFSRYSVLSASWSLQKRQAKD